MSRPDVISFDERSAERARLAASLELLQNVVRAARIDSGNQQPLVADVFKVIWASRLA